VFAAFFLGEYANILLMSSLFCLLFLGGWQCGFISNIISKFGIISPQFLGPFFFLY
jgi:NADH:ubiquinone oxidoreductase subunit H